MKENNVKPECESRNRQLGFILAAILLVLATPALCTDPLLSNGDFSKPVARGDWPAGWGCYAPDNGITWETEAGKHFLRIVTQHPGQLQLLGKSLTLPADINAITLSVRYRVADVRPGEQPDNNACVLFFFRDAPGRLLSVSPPPLILSETSNRWSEAVYHLEIPDSATRLTFLPGLFRAVSGTLDIAEISVTPDPSVGVRPTAPVMASGPSLLPKPGQDLPAGQSLCEEENLHFLRIVSQTPGQMQMLTRILPVTPDLRGVEIIARFRTSGLHSGEREWFDARTIVQFLDASGQPIPSSSGSLDLVFGHKPAPTDWKEIVRTCYVPAEAVQLRLMAGLFRAAAGTVDLADLCVTPLNDATLARLDIVNAIDSRQNAESIAEGERKVSERLFAQLAATGNLVPNGGFETDGNPSGWPADWGRKKTDGLLAWMEESGDHFMRLSTDPDKTVMLYRMLPLPFGIHAVKIDIRYRVTGIKPGNGPMGDARAILHFFDGRRFGHLEFGRQYEPDPANIVFNGADGIWQELHYRCAVPEGATKLQFMPALWNTSAGTLDLSEIHIAPDSDTNTP